MKAERRSLVLTRDGDLLHVVVEATKPAPVEIRFDAHSAAELLRSSELTLVVLDDEALTESEGGWMIDETHRRQPATPLVYVAARRSEATERMALAHGISLYAEKPIAVTLLRSRIRSLLGKRRGPLRVVAPHSLERNSGNGDSADPRPD